MSTQTTTSSGSVHPCSSEHKAGRSSWPDTVRSALAVAGVTAMLAGCGAAGSTATTAGTSAPASITPSTPAASPAAVLPRDIVAAPVRIADTTAGAVGYREVGTGSPILLVMGLSGSIDDWQPDFVAALAAAGHTVVAFDNAGAVPGAKLILYPGAGHGFLFQDSASFLPAVARFMG